MTDARENLKRAIRLVDRAIKTYGYYRRTLRRAVGQLYRGEIDEFAFIGEQIRLIEEQFQRAFHEGMRNNGLDPQRDMRLQWQEWLNARIVTEQEHILNYAQAIIDARTAEADITPLRDRADMWANRYNEIVHEAQLMTGKQEQRLRWELGATEQHCSTCATLNGVVAFASEWIASGYRPQSAPNPKLECGGWRCDCRLVPVSADTPVSDGGVPFWA